jgi:hypothetical protein
VSNDAYASILGDGERAVIVGPETVNGTGQVYLYADAVGFLSNEQARELGTALIAAADYAQAVREEMEEQPLGMPPDSVRRFEWTDPAWRAAGPDDDPGARCDASHRTEYHGVARCQRGQGHTGNHWGAAETHPGPYQWEDTP